jgi:hypothetical protein
MRGEYQIREASAGVNIIGSEVVGVLVPVLIPLHGEVREHEIITLSLTGVRQNTVLRRGGSGWSDE